MLSLAIAVAFSASIVRAASTLEESRFKPQYFTRKRILPFEDLLRYLLSMHKTSSQSALNKVLERRGMTMSQQALSKARSKFDHSPFLKLFNGVRDAFYGAEFLPTLRKFHDKFLVAIDGSETPLPNLPALLEKFGGTGAKASSPTARMSIAYDVLNDFIIDAAFSPLTVSERDHAKDHKPLSLVLRHSQLKEYGIPLFPLISHFCGVNIAFQMQIGLCNRRHRN